MSEGLGLTVKAVFAFQSDLDRRFAVGGVKFIAWLLCFALSVSSTYGLQVQDDKKIELSGFSLSEAFSIKDDLPFEIDQSNLLKLVYRLWQTSLDNLEKYAQYTDGVSWEELLADPPGYRLQVFVTKGQAKSVQRIPLPDATEVPKFAYRVSCVSEEGKPYQLLSLSVPQIWLDAEDLDQPIASFGFFYAMIEHPVEDSGDATSPTGEPQMVPLFLTKHVSWYPNIPDKELGVTNDQILLAKHNVDLALLDTIRQEDRKPLGSKDARPFYQFLTAVGKIDFQAGQEKIDHMEVLRNPKQSLGRKVSFQARVRKCSLVRSPVEVNGTNLPDGQYFQLMVFPDLRDSRDAPTLVEIGRGDEKLTYRRFPFTICCRQLPEGMNPSSIENQQIFVEGFFYRFWQYDAERTRSAGVAPQISPIIIVNRPVMIQSNERGLKQFFNTLVSILAIVLVIVGFTIFRLARRTRSTKEQLPEKLDFDGRSEM